MAHPLADNQRVYLTCRPIFAGNNAQLRKLKKIRELVDEHKSSISHLIKDFGAEKVVDILKSLLERGIFQSQVKAKIEFPELFQSSPARDVQRAASENDAARSAAEALEEIASLEEKDNEGDEGGVGQFEREVSEIAEVTAGKLTDRSEMELDALTTISGPTEPVLDNMPSLYPSYLPYNVQHLILTTAQRVLEECCFKFAETWMPSLLKSHGWEYAEAVELTKWTQILTERSGSDLPMHALKLSGSSLHDILISANKLRNTAVHRLPTTARGICQLIQSAITFTEALQDPLRTAQLEELHYEIDSKIKAVELNKNVLEDGLSRELQEIRRQREELDRKEKDLIARVLREDLENKSLIGLLLEESVRNIFAEQGASLAELEKDQDDAEVNIDEEELNGYREGTDRSTESDEPV